MTGMKQKSTRRAFFLQGSAVLGAGVATAASAATLSPGQGASPQHLAEREAIWQTHLAFTTLIEQQNYEAVTELFSDDAELELSGVTAKGKRAIRQLFTQQYREQTASAIHNAYRQNTVRQTEAVIVSDDGQQATATFHVEAEVCSPLPGTCTVEQMARLQGHFADRRWEAGRFEARYVKAAPGRWNMTSLSYAPNSTSISTPSAMSTKGMTRGL